MRLNPITERENNSISVPKAGVIGAALGALGTYAVPLTTEEHAKYFTASVKNNIAQKAKEARRNEIELIRSEMNGANIGYLTKDIFEKSANALENNPKDVIKDLHKQKGLEKSVKDTLNGLYKRVNNTGKITKMTEEASVTLAAKKDNRAALYYAGLGALALMTFAVLKNSFDALLPKKPAKKETDRISTMADFLINSSNTKSEIYIYEKGLEKQRK